MTNKIQSISIKSIDFKFLDQIDFKNVPQNIKNITNQLPNIDSAKGFVLTQKKDGISEVTIVGITPTGLTNITFNFYTTRK